MHLIGHLIVHLINQMFVGRMQMLERLTPDVTSIWREGGREGGKAGGSHDDVGASKIGRFDNGDKVVVCLMREFIDDSELHGDGARQHQTDAQVHICLVRRHPIFIHSPTSSATALERLPPSRSLEALMHDSDVSLQDTR